MRKMSEDCSSLFCKSNVQPSHQSCQNADFSRWSPKNEKLGVDSSFGMATFVCIFLLPTHLLRSSHLLSDPLRRQHFRSI